MPLYDSFVWYRYFKSNVQADDKDDAFDKVARVAWRGGSFWWWTWLTEGWLREVYKGYGFSLDD